MATSEVARRPQPLSRRDHEVRELVAEIVRETGDEKLARLLEIVLAYWRGDDTRVWRGPKWTPPADIDASVVGTLEVIPISSRRDVLSRDDVHRNRVEAWERIWLHLAGQSVPVLGWRGPARDTLYVFTLDADRTEEAEWDARCSLLAKKRPELIGQSPLFLLVMTCHGAMTRIEPGSSKRDRAAELSNLFAAYAQPTMRVRRLTCEIRIRRDFSHPLWKSTVAGSSCVALLEEASAQVDALLEPRPKRRPDAYPTMLACWLLRTGHLGLAPSTVGETAHRVYGRRDDDSRKRVRDNVAAVRDIMESSIQIWQRLFPLP